MSNSRRKVLFITLEPIAKQMAGPAIRAIELAKPLSDEFDVTVFSPRKSDIEVIDSVQIITSLSKTKLYELAKSSDILFIQANVLKTYPNLSKLGKYLVIDLYDPYLFSVLAQYKHEPKTASASYRLMHHVLEKHMMAADFSVCASERQRDYWIGRYCALGRLTPDLYNFDPSFRKLIDVVPFGLPSENPQAPSLAIKGKIPGISSDDQVLLWGGGIWEWFDPLTVIKAIGKLKETHPKVRLFFMGWKSPNPQVPLMEMALKAKDLAKQMNLLDKHIFFHESWIPYDQRVNYLLDTDIAVSAHFDLPETRFSFRTRILDYFWAGLPILTTCGDQLADLIESKNAGIALPYENVDAWANAIELLLDNPQKRKTCADNSVKLRDEFTWKKNVEKLRQFCRDPYHLPEFKKLTKPSLVERAQAVYSRGGTNLFLKRSKNLLEDILQK